MAGATMKGGGARDFSGGPNLRDAAPEIGPNEVIDALNVTFDERGGAASRLGYTKFNGSAYGGGVVSNVWWSTTAAALITQAGPSLYKGTSTVANKTFTTSARVGFADFAGKLCVMHPVDGLFTSTDGVTFTAVVDPDAPKGNVLEVWQNKLFSAGDPTNKARVSWSVAGDPTNWSATDFNEIRTLDNEQVVALRAAPGLDISGRSGMLAMKQESTYRIFDSSTGAYELIDATVGSASSLTAVAVGPKVVTLSKRGIFQWQNGQIGMSNVSDRDAPLWDPTQIDLTQLSLFAGGRKKNKVVFSLCRLGDTANTLALEYHPDQGWIAPGSHAMSAYATSKGGAEVVYGGSPTVSGQVYQLDQGGTDDGAAISWRLQTRWFELSAGFAASLWQVRAHGRGTGTMTIRKDYEKSGGDDRTFNLLGDQLFWDSFFYDSGNYYAVPRFQETQSFYTIGLCRQFSLIFSGSSTTTVSAPQVLGAGTAPTIGYFGVYGLEWLYEPLGLA